MNVHLALGGGVKLASADRQDGLASYDLKEIQEDGAVRDVSKEVVDLNGALTEMRIAPSVSEGRRGSVSFD